MIESSEILEQQLQALSKSKLELLQLLREEQSRQARQIRPRSRTDNVAPPASFVQQRLWFIDQLEGGSAGYTVLLALRLRGILDRKCLEMALDAIAQ